MAALTTWAQAASSSGVSHVSVQSLIAQDAMLSSTIWRMLCSSLADKRNNASSALPQCIIIVRHTCWQTLCSSLAMKSAPDIWRGVLWLVPPPLFPHHDMLLLRTSAYGANRKVLRHWCMSWTCSSSCSVESRKHRVASNVQLLLSACSVAGPHRRLR